MKHKIQTILGFTHPMSMISGLHLGTSGWSYKDDWKNIFYHSPASLLEQYLTYFDTAEINSTFYALPKPNFIRHLAERVNPTNTFTAKIPQAVTHDNRLDLSGEGGDILEEFFNVMAPLKSQLVALLIQLPPWAIDKMSDLETFLTNLDESYRYAIEFRHESWLTPKVWSLIESHQIAHVIVDEPKLPINTRITTDFVYIRWHGHGADIWYKYRYSLEELSEWAPRLQHLQNETDTIFGYFNNHFFGYAPFNALQMLQLLETITPVQEEKLHRMESQFSKTQTKLDQF
ncbi:MAG: DUF72 domain-containing protein [Candidatus Thorarchaeota archaeon]|nr:DUF72 domain-containing protein [Candidatus Thorarchaeota archaeon]